MKKILIVEDDAELSKNIADALTVEGFEVVPVFDGLLASRLMRRESYNCVLMDINLPGWNGFELCKYFRKFDQHTPILVLTAFNELEDKVMGYEAGADDYLTKPFYMKELLMKVQVLLKRGQFIKEGKALDEIVVAGALRLDRKNKEVFHKDVRVDLTPREFQILEALLDANGSPVSKSTLVKKIWGTSMDISSSTNTIEVYINFLRNKLDKPFGKQSIRTKVGFGYYYKD
ncbi:response regulator transcription factor [Echinicola marina]|uniref:response regulator transcription factor n=1 Tax=Echinicola marina TaxID=2859768 RepID=UPI001CF6AA35|nr:response regulator transcription factor [Echinicola marina]UCS91635.1 response regulator transcription factor [Echinicola marina]